MKRKRSLGRDIQSSLGCDIQRRYGRYPITLMKDADLAKRLKAVEPGDPFPAELCWALGRLLQVLAKLEEPEA